jgi:hypothetical protein
MSLNTYSGIVLSQHSERVTGKREGEKENAFLHIGTSVA